MLDGSNNKLPYPRKSRVPSEMFSINSAIFWRVIIFGLLASLISNIFHTITLQPDADFPYIAPYMLFQYLFSYQDLGFVRRSLIGSIFDLPNESGFVWQVYLFVTAQYAALLVAMAYWLSRHGDSGFAWIVILSPATFLQLGFDFGRLDALLVLMTALALMLNSRWPALFLPVMVLIHEGTIVMFAPLIVMAHVYRFGFTPVLLASVSSAVGIVIWFASDTKILDVPIQDVYPILPSPADILRKSFAENLASVLVHYNDTWSIMLILPFFMLVHIMALLYIIFIAVYVGRRMPSDRWSIVFVVACLTPLFLIPVGIDLGRWGALSVLNLIFLHLAQARWNPPLEQPQTVLHGPRVVLLVLLFASGPFAIARPFSFLRKAFANLYFLLQ